MNFQDKNKITPEISLKFSVYSLFMIYIVVLFHSIFRIYYPFIEQLTCISTSYFFGVSAFFFYRGLTKDNLPERLRKRVYTVLLPYFLWNFIYIVFMWRFIGHSPAAMLRLFTTGPLCNPSWYLLNLFLFFLFSPLIRVLFQTKYSAIISVCAGFLVTLAGYIWFQDVLFRIPLFGGYIIRMLQYFFPYLLGGAIGSHYSEKLSVGKIRSVIGIILSLIVLYSLFRLKMPSEMRLLLWAVCPVLFWEALPEAMFGKIGFLKIFAEPAFFINMSHCGLFVFWTWILGQMQDLTKLQAAGLVVITVGTAYILYYVMKYLLPDVLKVLTGNRNKKKNF